MKHASIADAFLTTLDAGQSFVNMRKRRNEQIAENFQFQLKKVQNDLLLDIESGAIPYENMDSKLEERVDALLGKLGAGTQERGAKNIG